MIIRSKSPLRLGISGGGTDVNTYCDTFGGLVLNATIDLYSYCTIEETNSGFIEFSALDLKKEVKYLSTSKIELDGNLDLHKGVYNSVIKNFTDNKLLSFKLTTYSDAPPGSGLGSSSSMVVAILKAFVEWLSLPLGEYDLAKLAYEIERIDIGLSGGKQDQYAAAFGGFNFMEFHQNDKVVINPLRVKNWIKDELEASLILYYTGASRFSSCIIDLQKKNTADGNNDTIEALHALKKDAILMKEAILKGDVYSFSEILGKSWINKKKLSGKVSNSMIDNIFEIAIKNGAKSGKLSGAGGGGFILFAVEPVKKLNVINALMQLDGQVVNFHFTEGGCHGWKILDNSIK
jgi:D-glycero-alpha-D-manno-heptose-7-phosphate kinase